MLIISQSRGKPNSVKTVIPLAHHKYSNELNKKDIYYSICMVKFLHTVCLEIKCFFSEKKMYLEMRIRADRKKGIIIGTFLKPDFNNYEQ